jgi:hypothetical protein
MDALLDQRLRANLAVQGYVPSEADAFVELDLEGHLPTSINRLKQHTSTSKDFRILSEQTASSSVRMKRSHKEKPHCPGSISTSL